MEDNNIMSEKRKLSTVLFADIAGYTALMQADEEQAMVFLNHFKELVEKIVPLHQGEIIQYYGDGVLLTFPSAKGGVECAIALQESFIDQEVPVRVGIHLGDVIFKNDNVFGDGVNIASRIESMGIPGSILISKAIRDQISNKSEFLISSLGSFEFKNVQEPQEVFALANEGLVVPQRDQLKGKLKETQGSRPKWSMPLIGVVAVGILMVGYHFISKNKTPPPLEKEIGFESTIAVFPFEVKGSDDIAYLGEGIVDLISTQLDEIPMINSVDPNRIFSQLEKGKTISRNPEKAAELSTIYGATKFILGSIIQIDDELQFAATKYDESGKEIARQSIKANIKEGIGPIIDNLTKVLVADELKEANFELGNLGALTSYNLESLKFYLEGEQAYRALDYRKARELFTKATEVDSTFALAWMRLFQADSWIGWSENGGAMQKWAQYKHTMPTKWQLYYTATELRAQGDLKAIEAYKNLIRRYGDTPAFHYGLAEFYFHLNEAYGRSPTEAKPYILKTLELDPGNQELLWHLGNIAVMENDMEGMQLALSLANKDHGSLKMLELIIQDTVTDAEIEKVLSLNSNSSFFPTLYFASEEKPFHNELISRIVQQRPSANGERFANAARLATSGREKEGFAAWQEMGKVSFKFGVLSLEQISRCMPANLIAVEDFLPFREHYESLYKATKDRETPYEIFAAIKYAIALNRKKEVMDLKKKLQSLVTTPHTSKMVKYFNFSIQAFEAKMAGDNDQALALIDSVYQHPIGWWETQCAAADKSILAANIYAEQGKYKEAINYFNHSYIIIMGGDMMLGYRNYKLSQWYEAIGDYQSALTRSNIFLENYKNCDTKYRPWVDEVKARRDRLISQMN
jgi:class 3 adenylate cyclase/tetratricopeptide (TPR) repeat protein